MRGKNVPHQFALYKSVSGTITALGNVSATGSGLPAVLEMVGTTIKAYWNSVEELAISDSDVAAAGQTGIGGYNVMDTAVVDNFRVYIEGGRPAKLTGPLAGRAQAPPALAR